MITLDICARVQLKSGQLSVVSTQYSQLTACSLYLADKGIPIDKARRALVLASHMVRGPLQLILEDLKIIESCKYPERDGHFFFGLVCELADSEDFPIYPNPLSFDVYR